MLSCFSNVQLSILWTIAHQTPLSMGFSRQEYWSGLLCPSAGHLLNTRIKPMSLPFPELASRFFTTSTMGTVYTRPQTACWQTGFLSAIIRNFLSPKSQWSPRGGSVIFNFFLFKKFSFYIGVQLINNIVIVSGGQQTDSAIYVHVSILPLTPLPSSLPHNIEQSFCSSLVN